MKLMFLFGEGAVGKMTVGQELTKITPWRLCHNHVTIEPVLEVFGEFRIDVILKLRELIFTEFAKSGQYGLIHSFMWAFDAQEDWDYVAHIKEIFGLSEDDVYYVELIAPREVRFARNTTENRLAHKASKRDIEASNQRMADMSARHRYVSHPGEIPFPNYLRLENGDISAADAARIIKEHFSFPDA